MNKLIIKALIMVALFTASDLLNAMMPAMEPYKIYIENHYGAPIKFKIAQPQELAQETSVANMDRVLVANIGFNVHELSIRTTGAGSTYLSPFTDLSKEIQRLRRESSLDANIHSNAIILIKPSKSYQNWDVEIRWEQQNANTEEMPAEEQMIAEIMNGAFGPDYAQKVSDISSQRSLYWKAEEDGNPDLDALLFAHIKTFLIKKNENPTQKDQLEQNLKKNINDIYKIFERYKKDYHWFGR
jgi:hypothetical protein